MAERVAAVKQAEVEMTVDKSAGGCFSGKSVRSCCAESGSGGINSGRSGICKAVIIVTLTEVAIPPAVVSKVVVAEVAIS